MLNINVNSKIFPAKNKAGKHAAISNLRISVIPGEFVCLIGPSGCGKTTLLNIIAGLDNDFEGCIDFDHHTTPRIGYVFQNPRLLPWRTVRENIDLAIENSSSSANIDDLLDIMQLTPFQHLYPESLSIGMSRRAAIIRAFVINPDLLLMDEPFVSLDSFTAWQIRHLLITLWQQRTHTVLFVTHDLREAIALADRIIFLTPAPMTTIADMIVTIPRHQRQHEENIDAFRQKVLQEYPELA